MSNRDLRLGKGPAVVGVDVGGTDIKSCTVTQEGVLRDIRRTPTNARPEAPVDTLLDQVERIVTERTSSGDRIDRVGIAVPGIVDPVRGVGIRSSNLGWHDAPLRELAEARLQRPVTLDQDVRSAGLAEYTWGAARGVDTALVVVIGTGIAAAVFIDGRPHVGGGYAGEIGHISAGGDRPCGCGNVGCVETLASATAIARRYGEPAVTAKDVIARAAAGDTRAETVWSEALDALAGALEQASRVIAPQRIVLGGGLSAAGEALRQPLQERLGVRMRHGALPVLVTSELGPDAGVIGAALRARNGEQS